MYQAARYRRPLPSPHPSRPPRLLPFLLVYLDPPLIQIWRRMLGRNFLNSEPSDSRLLATEAPFGPLVLQEAANEVRDKGGHAYNAKHTAAPPQ